MLKINLENFNMASYLLEAIQNISLLKIGTEPVWKDNPFKDMTIQYLSEKDTVKID